ncbi:MAG: multiubiquitin domain-containing protein [Nitrospirae bacterium]|nr:multiubiquitin domain-containing protein [Nitrospirota bacterium]
MEEEKTTTALAAEVGGKFFTLFIDGKEYHVQQSELTGAEIMDLGGIPREAGLIMILEDGTQVQVRVDEVIELKPGRRFKKAPRFTRG